MKGRIPPGDTKPLTFYFAGKITKSGWRHDLVDGLRELETETYAAAHEQWPVYPNVIFGTHHYAGPYFVSCDHGCTHGSNQHGQINKGCGRSDILSEEHERRRQVVKWCERAIVNADVVFAWIDSADCYGTLMELGYAKALGKRIWAASPKTLPALWFMQTSVNCARYGTHTQALKSFLDRYSQLTTGPVRPGKQVQSA